MKLLVVALLACATLSQGARLRAPDEMSAFGKQILMEVQSKMQAGGTIDTLLSMIDGIRDRITKAAAADEIQHTQRQENCTSEINRLNGEIDAKKEQITATKIAINNAEVAYNEFKAQIESLQQQIEAEEAKIQGRMDAIEAGRVQRAQEHEAFVNRSTDLTSVIAAVEEIIGMEMGSSLNATFAAADDQHLAKVAENEARRDQQGALNDNDRAAEAAENQAHNEEVTAIDADTKRIETDEFGAHQNDTSAHLLAIASKTTDANAKALVEVAAQAVLSQSEGDTITDLLNDLLDSLRSDTEALINAEKQAAENWARLEADITTELRLAQNNKRDLQDKLQTAYSNKRAQAKIIHDQRILLETYIEELAGLREELRLMEEHCQMLRDEYADRVAERNEELNTLSQVRTIVENAAANANRLEAADKSRYTA